MYVIQFKTVRRGIFMESASGSWGSQGDLTQKRERQCDHASRDGCDPARNHGMLAATIKQKVQ